MARFRVLSGGHAEESITNEDLKHLSMEDLRTKARELKIDVADNESDVDKVKTSIRNSSLRRYKTGDIVDSRSDLLKLNSSNSRKFEKLEDNPHQATLQPNRTYSAAELQLMTNEALKKEQVALQVSERQQAERNNPSIVSNPALSQPPLAPIQQASQPPKSPAESAQFTAKLDQMSLKDLQQVAADEEIDLKGASKREDVLRIVKQQLAASK